MLRLTCVSFPPCRCCVIAVFLPSESRHFEPLIADSAPDPRAKENGEEGREGGGGEVVEDKLAIWWQYIQAVQDKLPSDQQVQQS